MSKTQGTGGTANPSAPLYAAPSTQQPNVFNQAAGSLNAAGAGLGTAANMYAQGSTGISARPAIQSLSQAMGMYMNPNTGVVNPALASARGLAIDPSSYNAQGYGPATYSAATYDPTSYTAANYNAALQGKAPMISSRMQQYINPHTRDVVRATEADINRQRQMQLNEVGGAATAAGAFGGSRHGLVEAETNRAAMDTLARTSADLRHRGFETAGQLGAIDVGNILGVRAANQAAQNSARQFNTGASNVQRQWNAGTADQARRYGADARNIASQTNMAARNAARMYGSDAQNTARQFAATNQQNAAMFNSDLGKFFRTFNAGQQTNANTANAAAQMARAGGLLNTAGGFQNQQQIGQNDILARAAGMSNVAGQQAALGGNQFNIGNTITQQQQQQGLMGQALNQQMLDAAAGMFGQYINQPQNLLNLRLGSVGQNPMSNAGTTTTTQSGGGIAEILGNLLKAGGSMFSFNPISLSDVRFKENVAPAGATASGIPLYRFNYKGDPTPHIGPMAQDLEILRPEAVITDRSGVRYVDHSKVN